MELIARDLVDVLETSDRDWAKTFLKNWNSGPRWRVRRLDIQLSRSDYGDPTTMIVEVEGSPAKGQLISGIVMNTWPSLAVVDGKLLDHPEDQDDLRWAMLTLKDKLVAASL